MMRSIHQYHDLVRHDVFSFVPPSAGKVLDFGGGVGATSAALKRTGRADTIILFDAVATAAEPEVDAAEALDFEDHAALAGLLKKHGPFDTILCLDVLEHLRDPWSVMDLLSSAIVEGGCMIISLPNANHYSLIGPLLFKGRFEYADAGLMDRTHLRWFTRESALSLATCSGLELEAVEPIVNGRKNVLLKKLSFGMADRFVALQYKIRVRRR